MFKRSLALGLAIAGAIALSGCSPDDGSQLELSIVKPTVEVDILEVPEGVLPYTVNTPGTETPLLTFSYPAGWQSTSSSDLGVSTQDGTEMLQSLISANGEGVIVERFSIEGEKAYEVSTGSENGRLAYLSVLPNSKEASNEVDEDGKETLNITEETGKVNQTSRIIDGQDGYTYSVSLLQRTPSELTQEQADYILNSFELIEEMKTEK